MKTKQKIFNDPVYGFITIPSGILLDIIDHPYFQRLRRIKQTGLTHLVYPGALHTRFHHTLGALNLMMQAIDVLRSKGIDITEEEKTAVCLAILLHDIGHGPFSHALEGRITDCSHEDLSLAFMHYFNEIHGGQLDLAILIFTKKYAKKYLSQLVSGQLDMDRMDYLQRDSFYTGVSEGIIGYDRIIKMLDVRNNALVIEEKGIYSIEKFLISRRLMYWQVYLHKTSVAAELMLKKFWQRIKLLYASNALDVSLHRLGTFVQQAMTVDLFMDPSRKALDIFAQLDDFDITFLLKDALHSRDEILRILAEGILYRKLFKLHYNADMDMEQLKDRVMASFEPNFIPKKDEMSYLVFEGTEKNRLYDPAGKDEIMILLKNESILPFSHMSQLQLPLKLEEKTYVCHIPVQ